MEIATCIGKRLRYFSQEKLNAVRMEWISFSLHITVSMIWYLQDIYDISIVIVTEKNLINHREIISA